MSDRDTRAVVHKQRELHQISLQLLSNHSLTFNLDLENSVQKE